MTGLGAKPATSRHFERPLCGREHQRCQGVGSLGPQGAGAGEGVVGRGGYFHVQDKHTATRPSAIALEQGASCRPETPPQAKGSLEYPGPASNRSGQTRPRDVQPGDRQQAAGLRLGSFADRRFETGRPVQFELTEQTRASIEDWLAVLKIRDGRFLFPSRAHQQPHISTRQYAGSSTTG